MSQSETSARPSDPSDAELREFGYARGSYINKCRDCGADTWHLDKRCHVCRPCAVKRFHKPREPLPSNPNNELVRKLRTLYGALDVTTQEAASALEAQAKGIKRLANIVHAVLHILDDAEENAQTGVVTLEIAKRDWAELNRVIDLISDDPHETLHDLIGVNEPTPSETGARQSEAEREFKARDEVELGMTDDEVKTLTIAGLREGLELIQEERVKWAKACQCDCTACESFYDVVSDIEDATALKASGCPTHGMEHFFEGMCIKCGVVPAQNGGAVK